MTETILSGHYDWRLVALSIAIAICASYTALDLAGRTTDSRGINRGFWLCGGSSALGLGIWAMHYIGMLAYRLPVAVLYSIPVVALSLFAAMGASFVALFVVSRNRLCFLNLVVGSFTMGAGIATMHYTGMAAMRLNAHATYSPILLILSVVLAVAVSWVALHLAFHLRDQAKNPAWSRPVSAFVMGLAIASMHYTGMAAVCFHHSGSSAMAVSASPLAVSVDRLGIIGITSLTFGILALSIISSIADRSFSLQRHLLNAERERWELLISANHDGLFDADLVTGKVFYSPRALAILGCAYGDLQNEVETWRRCIHPDDKEEVLANLKLYYEGRQGSNELEYRQLRQDGSVGWILSRAQAVWDASGRPVRIVGSFSDITERKQALAALKASEVRFTSFMENSPYPAFIKDDEGRFLYANSACGQISQTKPGERIGRLDQELLPAALAKRIRKMDLALLASGGHMTEAVEMPFADGEVRQVLRTTFCFTEVSGRRNIGGLLVDITERVRSEERLRASQNRYRELFERNPVPSNIYAIKDGKILAVNQAAIDLYGWTREEFLRLNIEDLRLPGESNDVEAELQRCSALHVATKPVQQRRNNRSNIWVELCSQDIDFDGIPARLALANNVSARLEAESAIRQAHEQLESLVAQRTAQLQNSTAKWHGLIESLPQFVWSTTADGQCEYMSPPWSDYTGFAPSDLLGQGWLSTLHPEDQKRVQEFRMAARGQRQAYNFEYRIRSKEGAYRWFVARGRPVYAPGGEITHWIGTSTDIDDQKRSEELLEQAVAERTIELAQARDRAERAAQVKSEFLATMSHEIRTPMNGVIGMADLLMQTALTTEQKFFLDTIQSSGQALLSIINDILDFTKIEADQVKLENTSFNLHSLLAETMRLLGPSAAAKDLELTYEFDSAVPAEVTGDPLRLRQILQNLLSNAIKFTPSGSVALTVSRDETLLRFTVRDTGIGISPEQQLGLFEAFNQCDNSRTRRFGGTGLGLTIVKRLVELMGGTIGVSSTLGQGSTFWFDIPLKASASGEDLDHFVDDMPMQITALIDSVRSGRTQDIQQQARKIRSAAENVTGNDLARLAEQIERSAQAEQVEGARVRLTELEVSFIKLKEAIRLRPKA
jgi:PAS domain S-box-containing protein